MVLLSTNAFENNDYKTGNSRSTNMLGASKTSTRWVDSQSHQQNDKPYVQSTQSLVQSSPMTKTSQPSPLMKTTSQPSPVMSKPTSEPSPMMTKPSQQQQPPKPSYSTKQSDSGVELFKSCSKESFAVVTSNSTKDVFDVATQKEKRAHFLFEPNPAESDDCRHNQFDLPVCAKLSGMEDKRVSAKKTDTVVVDQHEMKKSTMSTASAPIIRPVVAEESVVRSLDAKLQSVAGQAARSDGLDVAIRELQARLESAQQENQTLRETVDKAYQIIRFKQTEDAGECSKSECERRLAEQAEAYEILLAGETCNKSFALSSLQKKAQYYMGGVELQAYWTLFLMAWTMILCSFSTKAN